MSVDDAIVARSQVLAAKYALAVSSGIATFAASQGAGFVAMAAADGLTIDPAGLPFTDATFIYNGLLPYMQKITLDALNAAVAANLVSTGLVPLAGA